MKKREYQRPTRLLHELSKENIKTIVMIHGLGKCWQMMLVGVEKLADG